MCRDDFPIKSHKGFESSNLLKMVRWCNWLTYQIFTLMTYGFEPRMDHKKRVSYNGREIDIISGFQPEEVGSIPITRSDK